LAFSRKLTEFEPPTRIRWAELSKNLVTAPEGGYDLAEEGSGTRGTVYNVLEGHGLGKLIAPLALRSAAGVRTTSGRRSRRPSRHLEADRLIAGRSARPRA
jgi:hypothetical protein